MIYFDTWYGISDGKLFYKSGMFKGKIPISQIREIQMDKTSYVGLKAAMAGKGMIIKFNRFDEIYIAPVDNQELLEDLLKVNEKVKVVYRENDSRPKRSLQK